MYNLNYLKRGGIIKTKTLLISLLLLCVVVLSASSAFAASEDATLNEVDNEMDIDDDVLQAVEDEDTLREESNVVTPENWQNFIDNETKEITYSGDELIFKGDFGADLNITAINVYSPIKLTGIDAVMTNVSFYILSDDVVMNGFTLIEDKNDVSPIFVMDVKNVEISDVKLNFTAIDDHNGYAIWITGAENIRLLNNEIRYVGTTVYNESETYRKSALYLDESNNVLINGNTFNITITSCHVDWPEIPAGSWNWVRTPYSEGIIIDDSDNLKFSGNTIDLGYNSRSGSDDTIYVLDVLNSDNATISGNTIKAVGADHIYGIVVENDDNFTISANNIDVSSDVHQAVGIDVEGPALGTIKDNNITAKGTLVNTVYSGMNWKPATVTIENNNIIAEGYAANAVELGGTSATVEGNTIVAKGNYTAAIISDIPNAVIKNNVITSEGSNKGDEAPGDYYMSKEVVAIKISSGVADISGNNISSNSMGVSGAHGTTLTLSDNDINVVSDENVSSAAICVDSATLNILNNNITYVASTVYAGENTTVINGVLVSNSKVVVKGNNFYLNITSCHVDWPEIPAGSWNWVRTPYSEGIIIDDSDNLKFSGNTIDLGYNSRSGSDDTIYVLDVLNSDNATISGNTIKAVGADHIYGIVVENDDNFTISANNIDVSSDVHQAVGIDVEGPALGTIKDNNITAKGTLVNTVYSGMNWKPATVTIENNNIIAEGYAANAVELGGTSATVEGNTIVAKGNYTAAIISDIPNAVIKNNVITSEGSNKGDNATGDYYIGKEVIAVKITSGAAEISDNYIESAGDYAIDLGDSASTVNNNYVAAQKSTGVNAIANAENANIANTTPSLKSVISAYTYFTQYVDGVVYPVVLLDENGEPISNVTIFATINGVKYNETTGSDGYAAFVLDLDAGSYDVYLRFDGTEKYGPKNFESMIIVDLSASKIVAPASQTVLMTAVKLGSYVTLTLKDMNGNGLVNQAVEITFNGKTNSYVTNELGVIKYKLSANKAGTYVLKMNFAGDKNYVGSDATTTVKINKEASKLTVAKKTYKVKVKTKKYTITLKDSKGKAIKKAKVTLKVYGKTYKATTNAKGKATFNIKNLKKKGKYTAIVKFAGNNLYKGATKKVRITVKK